MALTLIQSTFKQLYDRLPRLLSVIFLSLMMASYAQALALDNQADFTKKPLTADIQVENATLIVGSEQDYPPFATGMTDETAGGFTVELWKAVAAEAGLKYKIRVLPFHELLQEFKAGKIDVMLNLANTKERRVFADFSVPHAIIHGGIFVRKNDFSIYSESDLASKSVIVLNSDIALDYALSKGWNKPLILVDTVAEGMRLLASGKHDAMLINTLTGLQTLQALALTNIKMLNTHVGYSHKFAFSVRKNHSELSSQINEGFSIVKSNGTYTKLNEQWFGVYEVKEIGWRELLQYLSPIILLFFGFWQYSIYKRKIERKAAQKALQESESKLSTILESVDAYIYLKDMQGRYLFANRSVRDLFGVSMEGVIGQGDEHFFDAETASKNREIDRLVLDQGKNLRTEDTKTNLYDATSYTFLSVKIPLMNEIGQIYALCGISTDITNRKASEDKLKASVERHRAILGTAMDGFWQLDMQGHILEVNVTYCQMSGYSEQELLTMQISDVDAMVSTVDISEHLKMVISQGESRFESKHHRKDGSIFDVELSIQYLNIDSGRLIVFLRDITARKQSEADLHKTQAALQANQIELESQNQALYQTQLALIASRDRYVDLYEFAPIGYLSVSHHGMITKINWKAIAMFGFSRKQLIKNHFSQLISNDDKARWQLQFSNLKDFKGGEELSFNLKFVHENGIIFHASLNCLRMHDDKNQPMLRITLMDITQQKLAENDLRIAATAFESQEGMLVTDAKNLILRVNSAFTKVTGYSAADAIGQTPRLLKSDQHDVDFYTVMWSAINSNGVWEGEILNRRKNGEVYPGHLIITAVTDYTGIVTNYVATLTDNTLNKAAAEEIHYLAFYDALTSLPNRRLLLDRLNQALAASARSGKEGAVLFLDLDHFKTLNDTLGHDIGDALLRQVAERLKACVREGDTVARLGGDEYVIVLGNLSEHDIEAAAQAEVVGKKILVALNLPYQLGEHEHHCTSSIGITLFNDHKSHVEELLKQADIAMYQAKKSGRNMLRFFDREMQDALHTRVDIERELRKALEKKQFYLYYQIQVESSGHAMGAEVLIRWLHPERGLIPPLDFIPLAEETGLIIPIGLWVLETACAQLKTWEQQTHTQHLTLSVNVSAKQFRQSDFVAQVKTAIQHHAINPMLLKFELTESILLENIEDTIATMSALKDIGIRFSLDDFGTGYSSLQYLKFLPLYQLKIDQSFVRDIAVDSSNQAIVRTIIAMAHTLNLNVIAEGVETEEQKRLLLNNDCTHYQGYLFGRPMPISEFEAVLKAL